MYERHVVRTGDTISSIANRYDIPIEELLRINRLNPDSILMVGQELFIPPKKQTPNFFPYEVQPGDTLFGIGMKYNVKPEIIALTNGIDLNSYIYPGQLLLVPKEGIRIYVTSAGDTINDVLRIFNTTIDKIMLDNEKIYLMEDQLIIYKDR